MILKLWYVSLIGMGVIAAIIFITAAFPAITAMIDIAAADPSSGNYSGYSDALGAAPLWLYGIPVVVGGIAVIVVLRMPEARQRY